MNSFYHNYLNVALGVSITWEVSSINFLNKNKHNNRMTMKNAQNYSQYSIVSHLILQSIKPDWLVRSREVRDLW